MGPDQQHRAHLRVKGGHAELLRGGLGDEPDSRATGGSTLQIELGGLEAAVRNRVRKRSGSDTLNIKVYPSVVGITTTLEGSVTKSSPRPPRSLNHPAR